MAQAHVVQHNLKLLNYLDYWHELNSAFVSYLIIKHQFKWNMYMYNESLILCENLWEHRQLWCHAAAAWSRVGLLISRKQMEMLIAQFRPPLLYPLGVRPTLCKFQSGEKKADFVPCDFQEAIKATHSQRVNTTDALTGTMRIVSL